MKEKVFRTVKNVEILQAGVEYDLSTGPTTFTPETLRDVVMAANEDPSIPNPRLKIGHIDPRYNGPQFDGDPAFGKATNLRLSGNGMAVLADYVGVPAWLADIMPVAYPSRSIEGWWNVESRMGKEYRFVLSACSLLGVKWPGITVLEDLPLYYGENIPDGVEVDASLVEAARLYASYAAASSNQPGGGPTMKTSASANLDDVRRAFYNEYIPENQEYSWWWICQVLTDPNELVVEDDESGQLFKLTFTSDGGGNVSFGQPEAVRVDYIPDDRETQKAAASHVAATLAIGRTVIASWPTRAASRPDNTGGAMDPTEVRKQLNLPEDASDEQVHEALLAKAGLVVASTEETTPPAATPPPPALVPAPVPAPEAVVPPVSAEQQRVAASHNLNLPPGTMLVDEGTWAETQAGLARVNGLIKKTEDKEKEELVQAAVGEGRIPPARKAHWREYLDRDFEGGQQALAALSPNIIPLAERGHGVSLPNAEGDVNATALLDQETVQSWSESLFPEVRAANNRDRAMASGGGFGTRTRIQSDAHYRRG